MEKELKIYKAENGKEPFTKWFLSVKDKATKARIKARLDRLVFGSFGDYKSVDHGIYELRVHFGPGYRVYFAHVDSIILLLLMGGTKKTQAKDIEKAKKYWLDFEERYEKQT